MIAKSPQVPQGVIAGKELAELWKARTSSKGALMMKR
jgi:hypothetical protein